jgi:hypothetical protein
MVSTMGMGVNGGVRDASEVVCIVGGAFGNASSAVIGCLASLLISMDTSQIHESQQGQRVSPLPPPIVGQNSVRCQDVSSVIIAPRFELRPDVQGGSREMEMLIEGL